MAAQLHITAAVSFLMWTHLFEVLLTGAGIFLGPLMVVAAMGGALALLDRHFHPSRETQQPRAGSRSL